MNRLRIMTWLIAALALTACNRHEPVATGPLPVLVMEIGGADRNADLFIYSGEVRSSYEADLSFRIGGKVVERRVKAGDSVARGSVLAVLDPHDVELAANAAHAQLMAAQAELALAKAELERARGLEEKKFLSASAVDARRTQWEAALARVNEAKAQSGVSNNQRAYTRLLSPRDGVITATPVDVGQVVAAGQSVLRLADRREREVLINVPESRIGAIKTGQSAWIRPWNEQEKTLQGSVREIAGNADVATRTFAVRVSVKNAQDTLALGTTAAVAFAQQAESMQVIPMQALVSRAQGSQVWVVAQDNTVHPRTIEHGEYVDDGVIVRTGLAPGDRIVVGGTHKLTTGMKVRPILRNSVPVLDAQR